MKLKASFRYVARYDGLYGVVKNFVGFNGFVESENNQRPDEYLYFGLVVYVYARMLNYK